MGVAVADDPQVEVVGGPAAGEHCVQLLPGLLPGQQAVHGVGGDALGGVDGGVDPTRHPPRLRAPRAAEGDIVDVSSRGRRDLWSGRGGPDWGAYSGTGGKWPSGRCTGA